MNKVSISNYKQKRLNDYEYLTHYEEFDCEFKNIKKKIKFFRKIHDMEEIPTEHHYCTGFTEHVEKLQNFINFGDTAIDIGAYDGDTTFSYHFLVGDHGFVYAIEPSINFITTLSLNIQINEANNIIPYHYAVSTKSEIMEFRFDQNSENGGSSFLTSKLSNTYPRKRLVAAKTFDEIFKNSRINYDKLTFIKTDTEGFDLPILFSIGNIIRQTMPTIVIEWFVSTEQMIYDFCNQFSYKPIYWSNMNNVDWQNLKWEQDLILVPNKNNPVYF